MRFYETALGPAVFRLKEHVGRFFHSANAIHLAIPGSEESLCQAVLDTIQQNGFSQGYVRIIGFFGDGDMELHPTSAAMHTAIFAWPWEPRMGRDSIRVKISSYMRTPPQSTAITAKLSGHYANSILARREAREHGYDEALLLDMYGNIAEGPGANFFGVIDGVLITPPPSQLFAGITRDSILQIAQDSDIPCRIDNIHPTQLLSLNEAFFTGTAMEIISIQSIDDVLIQNRKGSIARQLQKSYSEIVHGKNPQYREWLSWCGA
jgi:branched-chain amino acid aminotransferase